MPPARIRCRSHHQRDRHHHLERPETWGGVTARQSTITMTPTVADVTTGSERISGSWTVPTAARAAGAALNRSRAKPLVMLGRYAARIAPQSLVVSRTWASRTGYRSGDRIKGRNYV